MGWVLKRVKGLQVEGCGRESRHIYGAHWTFKGMKFMFPRTQAKEGLGSEKSKKVACIRGWGIQEGSALNFNHIGKKHT